MTAQSQSLSADQIHQLLETASLSDVPASICKLMKGDACVIWKPSRALADQLPSQSADQMGHLYPYSSNFGIKEAIQHAGIPIGLSQDTTGRFYRSYDQRTFENDFLSKDVDSPCDTFMRSRNLKKVCLARFKMPDSSKGDFIVSAYRRDDSSDFLDEDSIRLEELANFLPKLYQRLVASQLKSAILKVNEILRSRCSDLEAAAKPLVDLCKELAAFFNFQEISVFMRTHTSAVDRYHLIASTLSRSEIPKTVYRADAGDGLTGYTLAKKKLIWFHDLHSFEHLQRQALIEKLYPGIKWTDGAAFGRLAKQRFGLTEKDLHPPLSFVAVPVLGSSGNISGAIRASLGVNPFHFLQEQVDAFQIIANEIGRWWDSTRELETNAVITHQLRTPIETAEKRLRKLTLLTPPQWNATACKRLEEVSGMVSKAKSVANTIDAFGQIVSGEPVRVECRMVTANEARKAAIEAALNAKLWSEDDSRLDFTIEHDNWGDGRLLWEDKFAQQCLDAVISNAFKYSGVGERVIIASEEIGNHFAIRVANTGRHVIRQEDVENCKKKDWRGPLVHEQDGRGLGLWIADHWMRAQGGSLHIYPTSKYGETKIELWFARK